MEKRQIASSTAPADRKRLLFEETLETDFKGSVYHLNLANFDINLENGLEQTREKFQPNFTGRLKNSYLNRFHILSSFLRKKPYAFSLNASKSREFKNREFFERQIINSDRFGGSFGFKNKFIPAGFSFSDSSKTIERLLRPDQNLKDKEISLNLRNSSDISGNTGFDFSRNEFSRTENGVPDQAGTGKNLNMSNQKSFSSDKSKQLYSTLHFYDLTGTNKSRIFNLNENLNIEHNDHLTTVYNYNFSDRTSSGVNSKDNKAAFSLIHRLYESLTSSFNTYYFTNKTETFSQNIYGLSLDENYVKKLGNTVKLSSGAGIGYSQEQRKSQNNIISIIDESHALTTGIITLLDRPRVDISTVTVTDSTGTAVFVLNADYQLIGLGERTQIQRIPGGGITNGGSVLVDYQAASSPSVQFNTLSENFRFRMDFFDEFIGMFYRLSKESHPEISAEDDLILQTLNDTVYGVDFHYKNLSVELESEFYDSSLSPYKQLRLKELFFFNPTQKSALTFQASQGKVRLINTQNTQDFFDFITRYSIGLSRHSRFTAEAGLRRQKGLGIDLDDITAGSNYELSFSKFLMNIAYEFRKQLLLGDRLLNHFFSVKIKRTF